jgi:peptidoglycan/LPS O-acetylase OafA/YrhL
MLGAVGPAARLEGVDFLKAAAITAVVFAHSGVYLFSPGATPWDRWLTGGWVWFHVPTFLLVAGFLYSRRTPVPIAAVGSRLARLLLPYAVVSLALLASGIGGRPAALGEAAWRLATGSTLGVYYFVPLLAACELLIWPLSRLREPGVAALLGLLLAYALASALAPGAALPLDPFWAARSPTESFWGGYFVAGWLAALVWPRLAGLGIRHRALVTLVCVAGIALWFYGMGGRIPPRWTALTRASYTFSVAGLLLLATRGRRVPRPVLFLSEASLALYLLHAPLLTASYFAVAGWSPLLRIAFQVSLGLGGSALVALAARRGLGRTRARRWLGA